MWSTANIFSIELLLLSSLATCGALIPFIVPISSTNKTGKLWRSIDNALLSFALIKSQKGMILLVLLSILLQFVLAAWLADDWRQLEFPAIHVIRESNRSQKLASR